ncbi:hypothetical protein HanRHA438_Chr15g0689771 [Helianthus annuus]|nr:hypothetical protein HanRHA438_Chr15g0689771 [Helianthus annuus]
MTRLMPPTKHTTFSNTMTVNGIMNIFAPSRSNVPFSYLSSFSRSTTLFVSLKLAFTIPNDFIITSRQPNNNALTHFMK